MNVRTVRTGETLIFELALSSDRAPPRWGLTYCISGEGILRDRTALVVDGIWRATFSSAETRDFPPGVYAFEAELSDGTETHFPDSGRFEVARSLASGTDRKVASTFAERALAKVEEVLLAASDSAEISFSVGDQAMSFESRRELMAYRERLRNEVERERLQRDNPYAALTGRKMRMRLSPMRRSRIRRA